MRLVRPRGEVFTVNVAVCRRLLQSDLACGLTAFPRRGRRPIGETSAFRSFFACRR
jgi:hypothetical protein